MCEKFLGGMILGMALGALLCANSVRARQIVKDGQEQVMEKVEKISKSKKPNTQED